MPSFSPTILINTTPAVVVTVPNLTYQELINSLGNYAYYIYRVYIGAQDYNQVSGTVQFNYLDATGKQRYISITPTIDPNQLQPKVYYDLEGYGVILNGNSQFSFNLLPNELVSLTFYAERISVQDGMPGQNNFKRYEEGQGQPNLFEDWTERV